jgi:hypothetical protein
MGVPPKTEKGHTPFQSADESPSGAANAEKTCIVNRNGVNPDARRSPQHKDAMAGRPMLRYLDYAASPLHPDRAAAAVGRLRGWR